MINQQVSNISEYVYQIASIDDWVSYILKSKQGTASDLFCSPTFAKKKYSYIPL